MVMLEVADIFSRYGDEYLQKFGPSMPAHHRRAFQDILYCRTPARGKGYKKGLSEINC